MATYIIPRESTLLTTRERRGRRRGLAALRRLDAIEATMLAADDPLEHEALVHLHDRVTRLTLRGVVGVRGLW